MRIGGLPTGTICSKHDEIYKLAGQIQDLVSNALDDGVNMERGLDQKRRRIQELEEEVSRLEKENQGLREEISDLERDLKAAESCTG